MRYALERARTQAALLESNEQLRQSQKMEAVGRLAGGVAHDFNNILTAILAYNDIALEDLGRDHAVAETLLEVRRAASHASDLTNQLLTFSRKKVIEPVVMDINKIITDTSRMVERLIGANVRLTSALEPRLGNIRADPGQMEQVMLNLVVNARDAMPDGGMIHVTTLNVNLRDAQVDHLSAGPYVLLTVSDTGTGIPEDVLPHIFEPFFTTKEAGKGTGLGLSTVYGIIQQSNGHMVIDSTIGEGTTFRIYFPCIDNPSSTDHEDSQIRISERDNSGCILLVEDDSSVRTPLAANLGKAGYSVLEAVNGLDALDLANAFPGQIDVLVTDLLMPEMGGEDLADALHEKRPDMSIIYVSGDSDSIDHLMATHGEDLNYLTKPFTPATLIKKLEALRRPVE